MIVPLIALSIQASQSLMHETGVDELQILCAIQNDDAELLQDCLSNSALVAHPGGPLLLQKTYLALQLARPRCVQVLLHLGAPLSLKIVKDIKEHLEQATNAQDIDRILLWHECLSKVQNKTSLELAAANRSLDIMHSLLNRGATITKETLLALQRWLVSTISDHDKDTFRQLIRLGASCKGDHAKESIDLLIKQALQQGDLECLQMAFEAHSDVITDAHLYMASEHGHTPIVAWMLAMGANPNAQVLCRNQNGIAQTISALGIAYAKRHMECFDLLLEAGANPSIVHFIEDQRDEQNNPITPLKRAIKQNDIVTVRKLFAAGANPNLYFYDYDEDGLRTMTALNYALIMKHEEIARLFIDHGAHLEAPSNAVDGDLESFDGYTPLQTAIQADACSIVELLLQKGVSVHSCSTSEYKASLLFTAACRNWEHESCARCLTALLDHGARPSTVLYPRYSGRDQNRSEDTELQAAIASFSVPCVDLLIEAGAHIPCEQEEETHAFHKAVGLVFQRLRERDLDVAELETDEYSSNVMIKYLVKNSYRFCRPSTLHTRVAHNRIVEILTTLRPNGVPLLIIEEIFLQSPGTRNHLVTMFLSNANNARLVELFNAFNSLRPSSSYVYDMQAILSLAKNLTLSYLYDTVIASSERILKDTDPKINKNLFRTDEGKAEIRKLIAAGLDEAQDRFIKEHKKLGPLVPAQEFEREDGNDSKQVEKRARILKNQIDKQD